MCHGSSALCVKLAVRGRSGYAHTRLLPDKLAHSGCIAAAFWPPATPVIVGTYPITVSGLSNVNYVIIRDRQCLAILTITPGAAAMTHAKMPALPGRCLL